MSAKIKTVDDIDIVVNDDGKFEAIIGNKPIRRSSLAAVEKAIQERRSGLAVQLISASRRFSHRRRSQKTIIAYVAYHKVRYEDGELDHLYNDEPFVCTSEQIEQIDVLLAEQAALDDRWGSMLDSLTKVTQSNFNMLRQQANGGES